MTDSNREDIDMVHQCLSIGPHAFGRLVYKYQSALQSFAWSILGDTDAAKDAVQEVLIKIYYQLAEFNQEKNFRGWIFTITKNHCLDMIRKENRMRKVFDKICAVFKADTLPRQPKNENSILFSYYLTHLKVHERIAISLKIEHNYSAREIGQLLNCSEKTAAVHVFNARKKLKRIFLESENKGGRQ
jgi:RNA polymerase sigma-70 factor (ECF subfamily)